MKTSSSLAAALAARRRARRPRRRLEAGHRLRRVEHRSGRPRPHRRRRAARRLEEGRRPLPHRDRPATGRSRATSPIVTGWAGTSDPALTAVPGGLRAFWGGDPHDRDHRSQPGPQHGALDRRRRDVGAAARLDHPDRRPGLRERHERDDAAQRHDARSPGSGRSARGCTRASIRRRRTSTSRRRSAATATTRGSPPTRSGSAMLAWFSGSPGPAGVLAQGVNARRLARRRAA